MRKLMGQGIGYLLLGLVLALAVPAVQANQVNPGNNNVAPDALTLGAGFTIDAVTSGAWSAGAGYGFGNYAEFVISDPSNVYCAGCLDFVISVSLTGPTGENINQVTAGDFQGFSTDMGYYTNASYGGCTGSPLVNPAEDSRSASGVTNRFNFGGNGDIQPGDCTALLVIETSARAFMPGVLSFQDDQTANVAGYQPLPEPGTMMLLGTGLVSLGGILRRRRTRS